jgi:hypothetical protein
MVVDVPETLVAVVTRFLHDDDRASSRAALQAVQHVLLLVESLEDPVQARAARLVFSALKKCLRIIIEHNDPFLDAVALVGLLEGLHANFAHVAARDRVSACYNLLTDCVDTVNYPTVSDALGAAQEAFIVLLQKPERDRVVRFWPGNDCTWINPWSSCFPRRSRRRGERLVRSVCLRQGPWLPALLILVSLFLLRVAWGLQSESPGRA